MRPSRIDVSSVLDSLCGKGLEGEAREEGGAGGGGERVGRELR